jgi:hypothetical protein
MIENSITHEKTNGEIQRAEDKITENLARFESAMERLNSKLEDSNQRIQHVAEIAKHQKDELLKLKNKASEVVAPLGDYSRQMADKVRSNPKPYIWTILGCLGVIFAVRYFSKQSSVSVEMGPEIH